MIHATHLNTPRQSWNPGWAALAALSLSAQAHAQPAPQPGVQLFGLIDAAAGRFTSATGVNAQERATSKVTSGGLSTSFWGIRGQEDLGGGTSALFELSSFMRNESGAAGRSDALPAPVNVSADPYFSRASWVGLSHPDWGRVRVGNITSLLFLNSISSNALGDSTTFSPLNLLTFIGTPLSGGTGWANSVMYDSPVRAGLTGSVAYAASQSLGGPNTAARLAYSAGVFSTSLAWQSVNRNPQTFADGTSANDTRAWQWAASYDFNPLKLYGHLGQIQNRGTASAPQSVHYRVWDVSLGLPMGAGQWLAAYGVRNTGDAVAPVPATVAGGNVSRKLLTVGYDHFLSRRTEVYLLLSRDQTETRTLPVPPAVIQASGTSFAVGIRHRF